MKELFSIFFTFCKVGALTFGGGYAMMPLLQREVVEKKQWASMDEIMDWYAIGQCLPGIIMINTSMFVGNRRRGLIGGIAAGLGAAFPSFVIITIVASLLSAFSDLPAVVHAFAGIRVCVCVLVANAVVTLWKKAIVDWKCLLIFLAVFTLSAFTSVSPVVFVLCAAAAGILLMLVTAKKEGMTRAG